MRQRSIMEEAKQRLDSIYAYELSVGDSFCLSNRDFKNRVAYKVKDYNFEQNNLGDYTGSLTYVKNTYDSKLGKDIMKDVTIKDAMKSVIFLKSNS